MSRGERDAQHDQEDSAADSHGVESNRGQTPSPSQYDEVLMVPDVRRDDPLDGKPAPMRVVRSRA
jgi:hypothetical protein